MTIGETERTRIMTAIGEAEEGSRGEIRVHIEEKCPGDASERAQHYFGQLGMHQTQDATGVLLYISPGSRKVSIYAGAGIYQPAGHALWEDAVKAVASGFKNGSGIDGIEAALKMIGEALRKCAPGEDVAGNELPDEVTTS